MNFPAILHFWRSNFIFSTFLSISIFVHCPFFLTRLWSSRWRIGARGNNLFLTRFSRPNRCFLIHFLTKVFAVQSHSHFPISVTFLTLLLWSWAPVEDRTFRSIFGHKPEKLVLWIWILCDFYTPKYSDTAYWHTCLSCTTLRAPKLQGKAPFHRNFGNLPLKCKWTLAKCGNRVGCAKYPDTRKGNFWTTFRCSLCRRVCGSCHIPWGLWEFQGKFHKSTSLSTPSAWFHCIFCLNRTRLGCT